MKVINLNVKAVKACLLTAAKNDCRKQFNGVFVDMVEKCLVGSDGILMAISKPEKFMQIIQDDDDKKHIILSRESLEQFFKILPKNVDEFTLIISDEGKVIYKTEVIDFQGSLIKDFRYGDWVRVYPKDRIATEQGGLVYINPIYLSVLSKIASLWDKKLGYSLFQFGASHTDAVLCSLNNDDMHVLIMPVRNPNGNNAEVKIDPFIKSKGA